MCEGGGLLMVSAQQSRRHPLSCDRETSCPWKGFFQLQASWPDLCRSVCSHPQDSWTEKECVTIWTKTAFAVFAIASFDCQNSLFAV